ncbi:uncharacterized protein LOC132054249 [Lycium ferocissimum]|uniref:uncharacterized protein LOC132054249 n=1 Tax=Lycium ferocissimum TaxID=112874 RepID=UPI00281682F5|nr:uncharacterized protein LOC132054249 [Lycium ferocissimum]
MADRSIKKPVGVIDDVLVQVGKFMLPADFVILDYAVDRDIPIILGRPFLATGRALMDSEKNEIKFRVNDEEVTFQASKGMKLPSAYESISVIDSFDGIDDAVEHKMEEESLGEALAAVLMNFDAYDMEGYVKTINALEGLVSYTYHPRKLDLDLANRTTPPAKPPIVEPPKLELKQLPSHLRRAIGWTIADIWGIPSVFCEHKIQLEEDIKPSVEHQWRLNQNMQEVVKKEIIKWLDAGVVYPIADSKWVSHVQCVPKKGGITVVPNVKNEMIPTRTVTGWLVCMDYRKLNTATYGYSGYNQINIALEDQEKVTFTCLYGTFAFSRMPFGLCNAPATFQRCMMSIFSDIVEDFLEAFDELKERLTTAPIIVTPDWSLPFELMCDASGFMVGPVLGQRHNKIMHLIYYASRTLNAAHMNYTVTEQELLAIVYAFENFRSYLLGSKVVVYTDHAVLRYLMEKKEAKPRLIRWVLLLQEFDFEVKDRKGSENQVADHLSRLEETGVPAEELDIEDAFPDEQVLEVSMQVAPWYGYFANYLVTGVIPDEIKS